MLTWEDCLGCCDVEEDLIDAVAEHEHLPEMLALEMANYLVHTAEGGPRLKQIILDDIDAARARGDLVHAAKLVATMRHFIDYARAHHLKI